MGKDLANRKGTGPLARPGGARPSVPAEPYALGPGRPVTTERAERLSQVDVPQELSCDGTPGYSSVPPRPALDLRGFSEPCPPPCTWWG
jgi:hypothetical protein